MRISRLFTRSVIGSSSFNPPRKRRRRNGNLQALQIEALEPRQMLAALLGQADFELLGSFRVPQGQNAQSTFAYGGTAPAFNPANNSLFVVGHDHHQAIAEISIPTLVSSSNKNDLNTASFIQPFQDIQSQVPNWTLNSAAKIGGLEVVDGTLVGTFYEYYDGDYSGADSHFQLSSTDLSTASVTGLQSVGNQGGGNVGGYMTPIPLEWQDELGATHLTGQSALAIVGRTSAGPAVSGFDPNNLASGNTPAINYLRYPISNPLRPVETTNPFFNLTTEITGVVFPENSSSVIFIGSHGTGEYCYGDPEECNDPARGGKGTHSRGGEYEYQAWAYDVNDFIAVKNGLKQSWEIQPYDVWTFDLPIDEASKRIGGVSYDSATGQLYVAQQNADFTGAPYPIINVFQLPFGDGDDPGTQANPPAISGVTAQDVLTSTATISWSTDVPANGRVEYGPSNSLGQTTTLNSVLKSNHSFTLTGLDQGQTYFFRVISQGADGQTTTSATTSFTTASDPVTDPTDDTDQAWTYSNARPLPPADPASTISVSTVSQLRNAVASLQSGQTISIAPGEYNLAGVVDALYVPQGISDWAIRGASGDRNDVVIRGNGMSGSVSFGFWIGNSTGGIIADLTIDSVREHGIIANAGSHDMLLHNLHIIDVGDQFIKFNPSAPGSGSDRGIVEYSVFEYRTTAPDSYTNAIDVHGGDQWQIRSNLFKNFIAPTSGGLAGPAVLMWNGSANTVVDGNTFINNARGISLGLLDNANGNDHQGGTVSNNMFYRSGGLSSSIDVPILLADSPGTRVVHNTILDLAGYPNAIEYRFAATNAVVIGNNLTNGSIVARDSASGQLTGNLSTATAAMFVDPSAGDLHLRSTATAAIDRGFAGLDLASDFDQQQRDSQPDVGADEYEGTTPPTNLPPQIDNQTFSVSENSNAGTLVGTITASDPDDSSLNFQLVSGNTNSAFAINPTNGEIRINSSAALNYEIRSSFDLNVRVSDAQGLSDSAVVRINVLNVNEQPTVTGQTFEIADSATLGTVIGRVTPTDPDLSDTLELAIIGGNATGQFSINPVSGDIVLAQLLATGPSLTTLIVQVTDAGGLSSTAEVIVSVTSEQPQDSTAVVSFSFSEGRGSRITDNLGRAGRIRGAQWTDGVVGNALSFDGNNDWVTVADRDDLDFSNHLTMSVWVKPDSVGDWQSVILKENRGGLAYGLYTSNDQGLPAAYVNLGGSDIGVTGSSPLQLNQWSHLAATFDGSNLKLFVNGQQVGQVAASGNIIATSGKLRLGGNRVWGEYFHGDLDEAKIYGEALSAAQIDSESQSYTSSQTLQSILSPLNSPSSSLVSEAQISSAVASTEVPELSLTLSGSVSSAESKEENLTDTTSSGYTAIIDALMSAEFDFSNWWRNWTSWS